MQLQSVSKRSDSVTDSHKITHKIDVKKNTRKKHVTCTLSLLLCKCSHYNVLTGWPVWRCTLSPRNVSSSDSAGCICYGCEESKYDRQAKRGSATLKMAMVLSMSICPSRHGGLNSGIADLNSFVRVWYSVAERAWNE